MSADKKTFWKEIVKFALALLFISSAIFLGIFNAFIGIESLNKYHLPFWVTAALIIGVSILMLSVIGQAIKPLWPKPTHAPVAFAMVIMTITVLLVLGVTSFMRGDNFDLETGVAQKWITPSTGKIWHEMPEGVKGIPVDEDKKEAGMKFYDPTTGEFVIPLEKELYLSLQRQKNEKPVKQIKAVDYKIYQPRSEPYVFNLKAGEITDHWIKQPNGTKINFKSDDYKFRVIFRDDSSVNAWEAKKMPNNKGDFKIEAFTIQNLKMNVN